MEMNDVRPAGQMLHWPKLKAIDYIRSLMYTGQQDTFSNYE